MIEFGGFHCIGPLKKCWKINVLPMLQHVQLLIQVVNKACIKLVFFLLLF